MEFDERFYDEIADYMNQPTAILRLDAVIFACSSEVIRKYYETLFPGFTIKVNDVRCSYFKKSLKLRQKAQRLFNDLLVTAVDRPEEALRRLNNFIYFPFINKVGSAKFHSHRKIMEELATPGRHPELCGLSKEDFETRIIEIASETGIALTREKIQTIQELLLGTTNVIKIVSTESS